MPSVLSPTEINDLRSLVVSFFPDVCQIVTITYVSDNRGDRTRSEVTGTEKPCKLRTTGYQPTEKLIASRVTNGAVFALDLAYDTAITAADRVIVNRDRQMEVIGIVEGGNEAMQTTAIVVERMV